MEYEGDERRRYGEVERRIVHILDYFDQHKESIVERMTNGVRLRELIVACFVFGTTIMGMNVYLLNEHANQPHKDAVHKSDFNRAMDKTSQQLHRLEEKIDRLVERSR